MFTSIITENTKSGLPTIWEHGGSWSNRGSATVICKNDGSKKKAIYVPHGGHLCNGNHALFIAHIEDIVISASQWRGDVEINIYMITEIKPEKEGFSEIILVKSNTFSHNEWDKEPDSDWNTAIEAAVAKCKDYHCRSVYYAELSKPRY